MITKWLQIDKIKFANRRGRRPRRPVHTQTNSPTNQNLKRAHGVLPYGDEVCWEAGARSVPLRGGLKNGTINWDLARSFNAQTLASL